MSAKDYYAALGIDHGESFPGIHRAYRQLAKECHPDRIGRQGTQRFQEVQEAYEVLSNPGKRKTYDASIDRQGRMSTVGAHIVQPLVPSRQPSEFFRPQPLVSPYAGATHHLEGRAGWNFSDGLGGAPGRVVPLCSAVSQQEEIEEFIMRCLRAFRIDRF
jgi:curved DNA-binding protein CbpA